MDTKIYKVDIDLGLTPKFDSLPPQVSVGVNGKTHWSGSLKEPMCFSISHDVPAGLGNLEIDFHGKPDSDPVQAVIISKLAIGKISSPKFIWQGLYRPVYPEPWASQQRSQGIILDPSLDNVDYLGWSGVWKLEFSSPIFTWIHQIENLGWIYD